MCVPSGRHVQCVRVRKTAGWKATDIAGYRSGGARLHYRLIGVIWRFADKSAPSGCVNAAANLLDSRSLTLKNAVEQIGRYLRVTGEGSGSISPACSRLDAAYNSGE